MAGKSPDKNRRIIDERSCGRRDIQETPEGEHSIIYDSKTKSLDSKKHTHEEQPSPSGGSSEEQRLENDAHRLLHLLLMKESLESLHKPAGRDATPLLNMFRAMHVKGKEELKSDKKKGVQEHISRLQEKLKHVNAKYDQLVRRGALAHFSEDENDFAGQIHWIKCEINYLDKVWGPIEAQVKTYGVWITCTKRVTDLQICGGRSMADEKFTALSDIERVKYWYRESVKDNQDWFKFDLAKDPLCDEIAAALFASPIRVPLYSRADIDRIMKQNGLSQSMAVAQLIVDSNDTKSEITNCSSIVQPD